MARGDHIGRYFEGPRGLEKAFKRNRVPRDVISPKERREVLNTLQRFRSGGGIDVNRELRRASGEWRRNTGDSISAAESRIIKRELRDYARGLERDPEHPRASFRPQHDLVHNDPRTSPSMNPPYVSRPPTSLTD